MYTKSEVEERKEKRKEERKGKRFVKARCTNGVHVYEEEEEESISKNVVVLV